MPDSSRDPATQVAQAMFALFLKGPPPFPRVAAEFDLTPPELHALRLLDKGESLPMRALADALYCDASYVTAIVDKLEGRGLIERQPDPEDRRVKRIALTSDGLALRKQALMLLYKPPEALKLLSREELETVRDILRKAVELNEAAGA